MRKKSLFGKILKTIAICIGIFAVHIICVVVIGWHSTVERWCDIDASGLAHNKVDAAIILGNRVYANGVMSPVLHARVNAGLDAYRKGCTEYIITSGGIGSEGMDEARVMAEYLIQNGVPEDKVIVDSKGINSHFTAVNAKKIFDERGLTSAAVVTSYYHVSRSKLALRQEGIKDVHGVASRYLAFQDAIKAPRDVVGIYAYMLRYGL